MTLKLIGIGAMGLMLSPSAKHLKSDGPAQFIRIYDRGTKDKRRDLCREQWLAHGCEIVQDYESLVGDGDFDGIVICAGKNGDDCEIFKTLIPHINAKKQNRPFILHLSTVSSGFTQTAHSVLSASEIDYVNYPLTGGPLGAENATMLILASGDKSIYERLESMLKTIGNPKYFGTNVSTGAEVKLMGQLMVFNGLVGISSAAALKAECFSEGLTGESQAEFFDFLNGGAGGTRQWDVALSNGVRKDVWTQGFMTHHAVVDAIYAAKLCQERGLPAMSIIPMLSIAMAFGYLFVKYPETALSTHAIARELLQKNSTGINQFMNEKIDYSDIESSIANCINVLPEKVKRSVLLEINQASFAA